MRRKMFKDLKRFLKTNGLIMIAQPPIELKSKRWYNFAYNYFDPGIAMSKKCQVTGKKPRRGKSYSIRGIAKKNKGIGLNVTGTVKRRFLPNLVKKRFYFPEENRFITLRLSTSAMRTIDKIGLAAVVKKMRAEGQKV